MKSKRRKGATLGLVAVCVLVIIVLGVGFFILSQILGGGREVANATDAGILTVARNALSPTLINVTLTGDSDANPTDDFLGFDPANTGPTDNGNRRISMLTFNRCVGQAVLVALNAQEIQTNDAGDHARLVATAVKNVGRDLKDLMTNSLAMASTSPSLATEFKGVAESNNTKMFQGNKVTLTSDIQSRFMRSGLSTNVYLSNNLITNAIPVSVPSNLLSNHYYSNPITHSGSQYLAGYRNYNINAGTQTVSIAGVTLNPQQRSHLIDIGEAENTNSSANHLMTELGVASVADIYLPPNAFRADTRTLDNRSGGFGGAVACAIVGALNQDFEASLPRGYVRIKNGPDAGPNNPITTTPIVDGANDVFNDELWVSTGTVTNNGIYALSSGAGASGGFLDQWCQYNVKDMADDGSKNGSFTSTSPTYNPGDQLEPGTIENPGGNGGASLPENYNPSSNTDSVGIGKIGSGGAAQAVTTADLRNISSAYHGCTAQDVEGNVFETPQCGGIINPSDGSSSPLRDESQSKLYLAMSADANGGDNPQPATPPDGGWTAVEVQKHQLLATRQGGAHCGTVSPAAGFSGMKKFNSNTGCYATTAHSVGFGAAGSPHDYLLQVAGDSDGSAPHNLDACTNSIIDKIFARMLQVDTSVTRDDVVNALKTTSIGGLQLNHDFFLCTAGPGNLQMVDSGGYFKSHDALPNDGAGTSADVKCVHTYDLDNTLVNAREGHGSSPSCSGHGDGNYHDGPYTEGGLSGGAADRAIWTPASGYRNLLGEVEFRNESTASGTFCKPN